MESILGKSWRTTLCAVIATAAWFISVNPQVVGNETLIALAKFVAGGGFVAFGINAKDKQVDS